MKTLLILRHGKAQENAPRGDKARLLTERGERESALMGQIIREMPVKPNAVVSSDAARARQTAEIAAKAAGFDGTIQFDPNIYGAGLDDLLAIVRGLSDKWDCVLLVGHNPGFEDLCAALAQERTDPPQLPTAGLACLAFQRAGKWKDVREGSGKLTGVYRPRDYREENGR